MVAGARGRGAGGAAQAVCARPPRAPHTVSRSPRELRARPRTAPAAAATPPLCRDYLPPTLLDSFCRPRGQQAGGRARAGPAMRKFMRTRSPPPPPPHAHANGVGVLRDELHSSLSRSGGGGGSQASSGGGASGGAAGGALFEDEEFPASRRSLGDARITGVRWRRPHELSACPRFRGDELAEDEAAPAPHDVARWSAELGALGCARLRAAAAALAPTPRLLDRAAPPQAFRRHYCGAFRFHFWVFGSWREVRVDDRLPERGGCLLGARAADHDYTLPLLEKAYAKLYGSYGALRGGSVASALQDLTGGVVQSFSLRAQPRALTFQVLNSGVPRSTLLVAQAGKRARGGGLRPGAPYCVGAGARAPPGARGGGRRRVRLRAPAGGAWAGAWSPASPEWRALAQPDRDLLATSAAHPGDFWMSFNDFVQAFSQLELVHVGPDDWLVEPALQTRRPWRAVLARRRWRRGYNAGGPPGAPAAAANPTFAVQLPAKCHVVVSVTQQYAPEPAKLRAIGFAVYEAGAGRAPLDVTHESRAREVVTFFTLPAGRYLVVPHTRRAHTDAAFLLRILTDEQSDVWEVNEDNVIVRDVAGELRDGQGVAPAVLARLPGASWTRGLRAALRRVWRACLCARPSLELCRALVALRDRALRGAVRAGPAGAGGAAGLLAQRLPARRGRGPLRAAAALGVRAARPAVGGGGDGLQQGAGVPGAALRARRVAVGGGLRAGAGAAAPRSRCVLLCERSLLSACSDAAHFCCRTLPQPGQQDQVQPSLPRGEKPVPRVKYIDVNIASAMSGWVVWWALGCVCAGAGVQAASWLGAPAAFDVESEVLLNDVARSHADVSYRIRSALLVVPLWAQPPDQFLLKFTVQTPKLYLKGKHVNADFMPYDSVWDTYSDSVFYGHWSKGLITEAYLDPSELPDVINYKKALLSLFQFQASEGRYNETDVSGPCHILYETISQEVFRKIKTECASDSSGVVRSARRVARYSRGAGGELRELYAEELLALGHAALGLKARSWHRLRARPPPRAPPRPPPRSPPRCGRWARRAPRRSRWP
ncbi:unnamed protein product [Chrysodeixis includens]|uniref:Calpain catalytic domain-containing protein n=1 Tax=Chrysodeixis includens TaxID=689277 RepID=A0A9N8Q0T7_CHRIL|nr:unnamed protein product [Chrysodeixis includens]